MGIFFALAYTSIIIPPVTPEQLLKSHLKGPEALGERPFIQATPSRRSHPIGEVLLTYQKQTGLV